jgi:adenosine deaminase CECR1
MLVALSACQRSSYDQHIKKRTALMQKDSALYFDVNIVLSDSEQRLNAYMHRLQDSLLAHYQTTHFFPPARNFYLSKSHIEQSPLFPIIRAMPKGGLLHIHAPAMGDADWVVDRAIRTPEMYVFWEDDNKEYTRGQMQAYAKGKAPTGFVVASDLSKTIPDFRKQLHDLLTFDYSIDADSVDIWREFELVFQRLGGFVKYRSIHADYLVHGMELLIEDQVQYVELRSRFSNDLYDTLQVSQPPQIEEYVTVLEEVDRRVKALDSKFSFSIIHSGLRFKNQAAIQQEMQQAFAFKKRYPQWLRGFDLVAEEDNGNTTLYHLPIFLQLDSLEKEDDVELPLYLHDGESNWVSTDNLYDAVLLDTKRIGHGFNLFRFPNLIELVKKRDICLEINPLSNQVLGYIRDLRNHPASTYLRRGVACSISSDDPLIFDYNGLSYDYWSIYMAWELDLAALKQLSRNGIEYAAMKETEKAAALQEWERRWNEFVEQALQTVKEK